MSWNIRKIIEVCYLKIDELKVNSYGKLKNKDIKFEDTISAIKKIYNAL